MTAGVLNRGADEAIVHGFGSKGDQLYKYNFKTKAKTPLLKTRTALSYSIRVFD